MGSNNKWMFVLGLALIFLFTFSYISNFSLSNVATDSGFDTSYSGGSSSSSSSDFGDSSGGGSADLFGWFENISVGIFFLILPVMGVINEKGMKKKLKWALAGIVIIVLVVFRLLLLCITLPMLGILFLSIPSLIKDGFKNRKSSKRVSKNITYLPNTTENLNILKEGYEIFVNVQNAWMNFDYNKLREETTDNLYNTYYNQLESLKLKGQKNVMHDFELINYGLVSIKEKNNIVTVSMELEVKFYDYIADFSGKVVRGNDKRKVHMKYSLTYVYDKHAVTKCPNCHADLNQNDTICDYCKSNIIGVRGKMKLSTKRVISQK